MNVDGAFILAETRRKTSVLLFVDSRFMNDSDEFGKMFVARIALAQALKKTNKNDAEQLTSKSVLAQIFLGLWTLNPDATSLCSAVWITYMQFVLVLENITFCSLLLQLNRLRSFQSSYSRQHHAPFFSSETWDAVLNSLAVGASCL